MVPQAIGLAEDWPLLSQDRIDSLQNWCGLVGNDKVMYGMLDVDSDTRGLGIGIWKRFSSGEVKILDCGRVPAQVEKVKITRFAVSDVDSWILRIEVWSW